MYANMLFNESLCLTACSCNHLLWELDCKPERMMIEKKLPIVKPALKEKLSNVPVRSLQVQTTYKTAMIIDAKVQAEVRMDFRVCKDPRMAVP